LSNVEKTKRETALIKADKVLAVCNIVAAAAIPFVWFVIL
jgi:hypothetical protein